MEYKALCVTVPRDLTRVKTKIIFNLTKRQLLCFGAAALIGVPSFFLFKMFCPVSIATLFMMIIMLPFFFLGMYEKDGIPCEKLVMQFIQATFIRPKIRRYQTSNCYADLTRQSQTVKEAQKIVRKKDGKIRKKRKKK